MYRGGWPTRGKDTRGAGDKPHGFSRHTRVGEASRSQVRVALSCLRRVVVHKCANVLRPHAYCRDIVSHKVASEYMFHGRKKCEEIESLAQKEQWARWPVAKWQTILVQQW